MKLLGVTLLSALALANDFEEEKDVLVLGNDDFDAAVNAHDFLLAEFYAPWCGHCKQLAPEYEKAAGILKGKGLENVRLAKVDATIHAEVAGKFGVEGYPTLKWFVGDAEKPLEYGGGRTADEIVQWITKKTGPPALPIASVDDLGTFKEQNPVGVVGFFADADKSMFLNTAKASDEVFAIVSDAAVIKEAGYADGDIVLFKDFDNKEDKYVDGDLAEFVAANSMPLVSEFTEESAPKIFGGDVKRHILLFTAKSGDKHDEMMAAFAETAVAHKGKVLFVWLNCDVEDNEQVMEFFGLTPADCPVSRMINMEEGMAKFQQEVTDNTAEGFSKFVTGVLDGTLTRHFMSEEIPEDNTAPVTILVGKNWDQVVKNEKSVFVEFYAPWCGHCQQLSPIWDKLGEHFKDNDDVVIAKSDATVNEFDGVEVEGFPTLKFWPKAESGEESVMMDYTGARTLEAMIKFVESNGEEVEQGDDEEFDDEDYDEDEDEFDEDEEFDDEFDEDDYDPDLEDIEEPEHDEL